VRVVAIAINTFREAVRNKILYSLLFFALVMIASALLLGQLSLSEQVRVTRDVGLGGIALFGVLIAVFVGVNLVHKEIDRKTVFALIPKPMHRWEFILGKYVGMVWTLAVQVGIMAFVLFGVLYIQGSDLASEGAVVRALALLFVEVMIVTAVAVLFSSFTTPFLSGLFGVGIFVAGRSTPELREIIARIPGDGVRRVLGATLHIVPDLNLYYVSGSLVDGHAVSVSGPSFVDWSYVGVAAGYGAVYIGALLLISMWIFSRRDFV
jgi:ABC-type transport system involved in multi-copper enzyme maturation permease subunit